MASAQALNICLVAYNFPILGRASDHGFLWPIARGLTSRGHRVTVISANSVIGKPEITRDGVRVFYLFEGYPNLSHLPFKTAALKKFRELNREQSFDIVHCMDSSGVQIGLHKKEFRAAVAFDVEATQMSQIFSILGMVQENFRSLISTGIAVTYKFLTTYLGADRVLLSTADGVFVTSPQQKIFLERYYLYPEYHTYTVPYGIELGDLSTRAESKEWKQKWKLPANAHIIVTTTDMAEPKEIVNLVTAFEPVAIKKPNAFMIVIGNGPGFKEIEYHILNHALGSRVLMVGNLKPEEVSDVISIADVYLNMSSRTTGFEPTQIEAMAQQKVIIGSEVSPIANVVEDGVDGFLLRPADTESLSGLLIEIFSGTLPVEEIGHRARQKVLNLFDVRKMVEAVEDSYRKILQRSTRYKGQKSKKVVPASPSGPTT